MNNLEYLQSLKEKRERKFASSVLSEGDIEIRKMNALEIIAEELVNIKAVLLKEGLRPYIKKID